MISDDVLEIMKSNNCKFAYLSSSLKDGFIEAGTANCQVLLDNGKWALIGRSIFLPSARYKLNSEYKNPSPPINVTTERLDKSILYDGYYCTRSGGVNSHTVLSKYRCVKILFEDDISYYVESTLQKDKHGFGIRYSMKKASYMLRKHNAVALLDEHNLENKMQHNSSIFCLLSDNEQAYLHKNKDRLIVLEFTFGVVWKRAARPRFAWNDVYRLKELQE